jgi:hypothetical protein
VGHYRFRESRDVRAGRSDRLGLAFGRQSAAPRPADIAPGDAAELAQIVIALRKARRALTRTDAHAAAAYVQHAIDLIDPRLSTRLEARLRTQAPNLEADATGGRLDLNATAKMGGTS